MIEIVPCKCASLSATTPAKAHDDLRTFLKRKGGLFKKAHELSVLCSVDVAVIIFGHNKKLYEFSSGDITETIGRYQYVRLQYPFLQDGLPIVLFMTTYHRLIYCIKSEH